MKILLLQRGKSASDNNDKHTTENNHPHPDYAHGWDGYTNYVKKGVFPKLWKMANVVPM